MKNEDVCKDLKILFYSIRFFFYLLIGMSLVAVQFVRAEESFLSAQRGYSWRFPKDHGVHEGFQTEWWYYTGQLYTHHAEPFKDSPTYGFQLTFFRRALSGAHKAPSFLLAHAVITEIKTGRVLFKSRVVDSSIGVGRVAQDRLDIALADWSAEMVGGEHILRFSTDEAVPATADSARYEVRLRLVPSRANADGTGETLQGERGYSKKGYCDSCASLYYSVPRMSVSGEVYTLSSKTSAVEPVRGIAWMDHETMTNALSPDQEGWDWMGLMTKDGRSLTAFRLRSSNDQEFLSATLCKAGECEQLTKEMFSMKPVPGSHNEWSSPLSGAHYPVKWHVTVPSAGIDSVLDARVAASEIAAKDNEQNPKGSQPSVIYWEGPVANRDESITGYLEMTGYAGKVSF